MSSTTGVVYISLMIGLVFSMGASAIEPAPQSPDKIKFIKILTEAPETSWEFLKSSFSKDALAGWGVVLGTSVVLYHYDEDLIDGSQRTGRRWGLSNHDKTTTIFKIGKYDGLRLPSDTASALYFMGDGWVDFALAGGLMANGLIYGNSRPYNTGVEIIHGMFVAMIFDQALKRATGRESPSDATEPRGRWRPFPSISAYNSNTAKYDAMPSGHMMTSTLVFTILRANYVEYDHILFPLEIGWLSVLGFAMMNNGVHWASDYPLGIAMGYMIGKASLRLAGPVNEANVKSASNWFFMPSSYYDGTPIMNAVHYF